MISREAIAKINDGTYKLGVTGTMSSGKTYLCNKLIDIASKQGMKINYVSFDAERRFILDSNSPYQEIRDCLSQKFGKNIIAEDKSIDREALGNLIYFDNQAMTCFKELVYPVVRNNVYKKINEKHGLTLFEWAMLVEDDYLAAVENNVLFVRCSEKKQRERLSKGDLPPEQTKMRIQSQISSNEKENQIKNNCFVSWGNMYVFDTTNNPVNNEYEQLLEQIVREIL